MWKFRAAALKTLKKHGLSVSAACALVADEEDRAELDEFLSARIADIDVETLVDLAHALGLTVSQMIGAD